MFVTYRHWAKGGTFGRSSFRFSHRDGKFGIRETVKTYETLTEPHERINANVPATRHLMETSRTCPASVDGACVFLFTLQINKQNSVLKCIRAFVGNRLCSLFFSPTKFPSAYLFVQFVFLTLGKLPDTFRFCFFLWPLLLLLPSRNRRRVLTFFRVTFRLSLFFSFFFNVLAFEFLAFSALRLLS